MSRGFAHNVHDFVIMEEQQCIMLLVLLVLVV
jgi:hypothetical protein